MKLSRIIFTGDFNDSSLELFGINPSVHQFSIKFFGYNLYCGNRVRNIPNTCCYGSKTNLHTLKNKGDYILDTRSQQYFDVPLEYDLSKPHSDHLPVIGIY